MEIKRYNIPKLPRNKYGVRAISVSGGGSKETVLVISGDYLPATKNEDDSYTVDLSKVTFKGDILTEGGITAFTKGDKTTATIMDGVVTDNTTIIKDNGVLKVVSGGFDEKAMWQSLGKDSNNQINLAHLPDVKKHLEDKSIHITPEERTKWNSSVDINHTHSWNDIDRDKPTTLEGYGITGGTATGNITAANLISNDKVTINGIEIKKDTNNILTIDGDLAVTGNVTSFAKGDKTASTIMDGIATDNVTIHKNEEGVLEVITGGVGSDFDAAKMWDELQNTNKENQINISHITPLDTHLKDKSIHITSTERTNWNNKLDSTDAVGKKTAEGGEIFNDYSNNKAGNNATAIGTSNQALGDSSFAGGVSSSASGQVSFAFGLNSVVDAAADSGVAIGYGATVNNAGEISLGSYNRSNPNTKFSLGAGYAPTEKGRKNVVEVLNNDNLYVKGIGNFDGTNVTAEGVKPLQEAIKKVESADKLSTARNIWGLSFDGTADVSGKISNATDISASGDVASSTVTINGIKLSKAKDGSINLDGDLSVNGNIYSEGGVTAFAKGNRDITTIMDGVTTDNITIHKNEDGVLEVLGTKGSEFDENAMWKALFKESGNTISLSHLPEVKTHLKDNTKHITSGERTQWNTAYNKAHSHSNKSVLDGISETSVSHWNGAYNNLDTVNVTETTGNMPTGIALAALWLVNDKDKYGYSLHLGMALKFRDYYSGKWLTYLYKGGADWKEEDYTNADNWVLHLTEEPTPVIDNLTSSSGSSALSANLGRILNNAIGQKLDKDANAVSASKLKDARKLWGLAFDGTKDISGNITGAGNITASGDVSSKSATIDSIQITKDASGVLLIDGDVAVTGNVTTFSKNGRSTSTIMDGIATDNTTILVNPETKVLEVLNGGIGSDFDEKAMWDSLGKGTNNTINLSHLPTVKTHIEDKTKHITAAERTQWNTAYNNNHSHSNKGVLDGISQNDVNNWNGKLNASEAVGKFTSEGGEIFNTYIGLGKNRAERYAHSEGYITASLGLHSHSEGDHTKAGGWKHKTNGEIQFDKPSDLSQYDYIGHSSHAEGSSTEAIGNNSHSEGEQTKAVNQNAHAEGYKTTANGNNAHTEGESTITHRLNCHAEGKETEAGNPTDINKSCGHAEGWRTKAYGANAHSEGAETVANGHSSHTEGTGTIANNANEHSQGKYNKSNTDTLHSIGIGSGDKDRKNAVEVLNNGNVYIKGIGGFTGDNLSESSPLSDAIKEVDSAKKLSTSRKLWGLPFDGTKDVSGMLDGVSDINTTSSNWSIFTNQANTGIKLRTEYADWYVQASDESLQLGSTSSPIEISANGNISSKTTTIDSIPIKKDADGILVIDGSVAVTGDITSYARNGRTTATIMDGVITDNVSIKKNASGALEVITKSGADFDSNKMWKELNGNSAEQINISHLNPLNEHLKDNTKHITSTERTNWNDANSKKHSHTNKATLDGISSTLVTNWNTAYTNNHTHSNKAILDGISTSDITNWDNMLPLTGGEMIGGGNNKISIPEKFSIYAKDLKSALIYYNQKNGYLGCDVHKTFIRSGNYNLLHRKGNTDYIIFDLSNYNTYVPTKDGVGASGTWGINITGNAASANQLLTARTLWGLSFNGTNNVSGALTDVTDITASGNITSKSILLDSIPIKKDSNGVLLIDGSLAVTGDVTTYSLNGRTTPTIMDGITCDETTITKAGGVLSVKGGVGSDFDVNKMWAELNSNTKQLINLSHIDPLNTHINNSNIHITNSEKTNWNDAYNKRHTHSNFALIDSISENDKENWDRASANSHTHSNKAILDKFQSNSDGGIYINVPLTVDSALTTTEEVYSTGLSSDLIHIETNADGVADGGNSGEINCWEDAIYIQLQSPCDLTLCSGGGKVGVGKYPDLDVKLDVKGDVKIDGNLAVTGNITSFALNGRTISTIMDGVTCDEQTITKDNGVLKVIGGSDFDAEAMWNELRKPDNTKVMDISHLGAFYETHFIDSNIHISGTEREKWNEAYNKRHEHSNKTVLDGISSTSTSNWNDAYSKRHSHSNKTVLDGISSTKVSNWNTAYSNYHSHSNKSILDGISNTDVTNWDSAYSDSHTHSNKAVLDNIGSTDVNNWDEAYTYAHTHGNQAVLDDITDNDLTDLRYISSGLYPDALGSFNVLGSLTAENITSDNEVTAFGFNSDFVHIETDADGLSGGNFGEINNWDSPLWLQAQSKESIVLCNGGGNVGIGARPDTSVKLDVKGNIRIGGVTKDGDPMDKTSLNPLLIFSSYEGGKYIQPVRMIYTDWNSYSGAGTTLKVVGEDLPLLFEVDGNIKTSGEITAFSDKRLKSNIQPLEDRGRLQPVTYVKDGKDSIGFIALDVLKLYPELVTGSDTPENYLSLNYPQITAVLSAQLNKALDTISKLEQRVDKLENELSTLKTK